ncbi:hypothetical protein ACVWY2_008897 [Bradyrhizobium sp. JR6.1]
MVGWAPEFDGKEHELPLSAISQILRVFRLLQIEIAGGRNFDRLKIEGSDRDKTCKEANFLDRAAMLEHGGRFLINADATCGRNAAVPATCHEKHSHSAG